MALTDRAVKALKPQARSYRKSDFPGGLKGLNIQVTPNGVRSWMLRYVDRFTAKERFHTFGSYPDMSLAEAREEARSLKAKVAAGEPLVEILEERQVDTEGAVKQLLTGYWEDLQDQGKPSWEQVKSRCEKHVIPHIGDLMAREVTEDQVIAVLSKIFQAGHRPMANRVRTYLQTAWKWGKSHDRDYRYHHDGIRFSLASNPVSDIPRDKAAERVDDRVLEWNEIKALWYACTDVISLPMRLACQLMLATGGQRPGEIIGLHDRELNLAARTWLLPGSRAKNGLDHMIPLTDTAITIIKQAKRFRGNSKYIFPKRDEPKESAREDSLYTAVRRYCQSTGLPAWTPKDLRTTFKTRGGEVGLSKEIRDRLQNHAFSDVSSKHYDMWSYLPEKRAAIEKWERELWVRL
ncbi:MAG: integrase arm-type DNA-binding domain-containing protein [Candidatus Sedimenticola sp. (ex Thyasira tokunagai)]